MVRSRLLTLAATFLSTHSMQALDREGVEFKVYQFPKDAIPRIDGDVSDWDQVPESYIIGTNELWDDSGQNEGIQPETLDIKVRVAWVEGLNRLYFLYEAYDDYWDFALPGLRNDTFEVVVDGDLSGGPLIERFRINNDVLSEADAFFTLHGAHAQNYHIFTPARDKSWTMLWGTQQWLKELPYANAASHYDFSPGESGRYTLEFYITAFDHASPLGPSCSTESQFEENKIIGLSWAIIDYDENSKRNSGFWNLSRVHTMYGKADELVAFRLMPPEQKPTIQADWDFTVVDQARRLVAFHDESDGDITSWYWDFGDGNTSNEQHPTHTYDKGDKYVVVLTVIGPEGESRWSKVWDVSLP
ncbi:PKD domain-containing protein [Pelagicoccus mobilis]|uniref:PKD domain-containing protein n=1 Tax=Pelagicoccus mobilis TaxID=415221 RepID=A0A934RS88_9BACT|nr:PKD domain-containing protein [Pelagicoccus mobilis]MBK1875458.1 PKD domain-containing protein [Pelagicoccus mobilis]